MKIAHYLLATATIFGFCSYATAQEVTLTFDDAQVDFGAYELTGVDTELTLARSGGAIASNDFTELTGLATETYTASGTPLGLANPFQFSVTAAGGVANVVSGGLDVDGGGVDDGESLTFIFNRNITISQFDLSDIGTSEFATISVAGTSSNYGNNFSGSGDVIDGSFSLAAGQALVFSFTPTSGADYEIQGITFTVVPEPGTYALLSGFCALASVMLRRRSVK